MIKITSIFLFTILSLTNINAQVVQDTIYVHYGNSDINISGIYGRVSDYDSTKNYPFDMGRIYTYKVNDGQFLKEISFKYTHKPPEWTDFKFHHIKANKSILSEKDFKDTNWFKTNNFDEIVRVFSIKNSIIYLVDSNYFTGEDIYLIRVYFNHQAEE